MTLAKTNRVELLMDIARRYYLDGASQNEIADAIRRDTAPQIGRDRC
jgi:hypothetical protein